ncbi:hypothetical protein J6590_024151 [Homalodisca vitripennis]|nr:hypothetical protein J6590_024151 [Homalodisca vitripennis]
MMVSAPVSLTSLNLGYGETEGRRGSERRREGEGGRRREEREGEGEREGRGGRKRLRLTISCLCRNGCESKSLIYTSIRVRRSPECHGRIIYNQPSISRGQTESEIVCQSSLTTNQ